MCGGIHVLEVSKYNEGNEVVVRFEETGGPCSIAVRIKCNLTFGAFFASQRVALGYVRLRAAVLLLDRPSSSFPLPSSFPARANEVCLVFTRMRPRLWIIAELCRIRPNENNVVRYTGGVVPFRVVSERTGRSGRSLSLSATCAAIAKSFIFDSRSTAELIRPARRFDSGGERESFNCRRRCSLNYLLRRD